MCNFMNLSYIDYPIVSGWESNDYHNIHDKSMRWKLHNYFLCFQRYKFYYSFEMQLFILIF